MSDTQYPRYGELDFALTGAGMPYVSRPFYIEFSAHETDVIYPGLTTDFASTSIAGFWLKPWGPWAKPAVVHDRDYRYGKIGRREADTRFYDGVRVLGTDNVKAAAMYYTLRALGWRVWRRYRDNYEHNL